MGKTAFCVLAVLGAMAIGCESEVEGTEPAPKPKKEEKGEQYGPWPTIELGTPKPTPAPVCWNDHGGASTASASCGSNRNDFAETVRQHVVEGAEFDVGTVARRYVQGVITAYTSCIAEWFQAALLGKKTVDCTDNYKSSFAYGMHPTGTIFIDAKQSAGFNANSQLHATEGLINITFFWKNGTPINADMFKPESYLVGFRPELQNGKAVIAYDSYGPLVELLGYGPNPPNPIVISLDDQNKPSQAFNALVDVDGDSHVRLGDCGVASVFDNKLEKTPVSQPLVTKLTKGESLGQDSRTATVTSWASGKVALDFENAAPLTKGLVTFTPNSGATTLALTCP